MIDRHLLETWLNRGLRFANLPKDFLDATADDVLCGRDWSEKEIREAIPLDRRAMEDGPGHPWHGPGNISLPVTLRRRIESRLIEPYRRYQFLHALWNYFLERLVAGGKEDADPLRDVCQNLSMNEEGESNLVFHRDEFAPFGFDDSGQPQMQQIQATRPEGLLSVVGAELLSPSSAFEIAVCKGCHADPLTQGDGRRWIDCGHFLKSPLPRKPHGQRKYCDECLSTGKSTIYVNRNRKNEADKKLTKAKHK